MQIFLVGFMGSGKTTLGKKLASSLHYSFLDMDERIESREGKTIPALFDENGAAYFRKAEHHALQAICNEAVNRVVATGGGAPCYYNNMELMNKTGITVYLKMPPQALAGRLRHATKERPLVAGKTMEELLEYIIRTLNERRSYYEQSHITIQGINATADLLHRELAPYLKGNV